MIAEIKRRSPSKGGLAADSTRLRWRAPTATRGANAISVFTDEDYFAGSLEDLDGSSRGWSICPSCARISPSAENDVLDAADAGANAVLLIVAALSDAELASFIGSLDSLRH